MHPPAASGNSREEPPENDFPAAAALAEEAARHALDAAGLAPQHIGGLVALHDTSHTGSEGLALHLINALKLPPTTSYVPLAPHSSTGGIQALETARILAQRTKRVLVVGVDTHSGLLTNGQIPLARRLLLADGAAATVVSTDAPAQGGSVLRLADFWTWTDVGEYANVTVPDATAHFATAEDAAKAVREAVARVPWFHESGQRVDFALVHPGGPRYLQAAGEGPLAVASMRPSWDTLKQDGDTGATAILRVLARAYDASPPPDASGVLIAVSPVHTAACRAHWLKSD
ncbi:hypothetical protein ACWCOW_38150 [Streptomyces sp. NPDC001939]